jgi:ribosomal protein S18 acetylase RimI-like enzyme
MSGEGSASYRPARGEDLPELGRVFAAAFPESVQHVTGGIADTGPLGQMFAIALEGEPEGLIVAESEGRLAGYVLAVMDAAVLRRAALRGAGFWRLAGAWLRGDYGPRWRALVAAAVDKISFWRHNRSFTPIRARVLSMAVHPDFQGQGWGRGLFEQGLAYLRRQGARGVRLEVRPDNVPARTLYEKMGFTAVGRYRDGRGEWLAMTRPLEEQEPAVARRPADSSASAGS